MKICVYSTISRVNLKKFCGNLVGKVVQKLEFLLYFSKRFHLVDNDVSRLEANKLPNGINLEARWSHMFPDINTIFFQIVTLSTWINLKLIK